MYFKRHKTQNQKLCSEIKLGFRYLPVQASFDYETIHLSQGKLIFIA